MVVVYSSAVFFFIDDCEKRFALLSYKLRKQPRMELPTIRKSSGKVLTSVTLHLKFKNHSSVLKTRLGLTKVKMLSSLKLLNYHYLLVVDVIMVNGRIY